MWRNWQLRKRAHPAGEEASLRRRTNKENFLRQQERRLCLKLSRDSGCFELQFNKRVWRNWQTRKIQVLMFARMCRFKSCYPHQKTTDSDGGLSFLTKSTLTGCFANQYNPNLIFHLKDEFGLFVYSSKIEGAYFKRYIQKSHGADFRWILHHGSCYATDM